MSEQEAVTQEQEKVTENIEEDKSAQEAKAKDENMRYSGFWVRGAGFIIDSFIVNIALQFILMPIFLLIIPLGVMDTFWASALAYIIITLVSLGVTFGYFIFMTHKFQATVGKMAIGAKVYAENGEKLTLGKIVLRETVGKLISSVIFYIGYIIAGFTSKKQSLHDIMAHSVVVYDEKGPNKMGVGITWGCYTFLILGFMIFFGILISLGMWVSTIENEIIDYEEYYEGLEADMNEIELQESNTVQGIEILDMQGSEDVIELQELGGAGVSVE